MNLDAKLKRREIKGYTAGLIDPNNAGGSTAYGNPEKFFGATAANQADLHFVNCVLTEQDDNKNGFFFKQSTLIKFHSSARLKPYNMNHKADEVIGVIFDSALANDQNEVIDEENDIEWGEDGEPKYKGEGKIRVLVAAALYGRTGSSPASVKEIVEKVQNNEKMCVSMECWYSNYDYYLIDPENNIEIKERNKASLYLDNHIGKVFGGKRVCAAFKDDNFLFGGIGQVKKGACEESVILAAAQDKEYKDVEGPSIFDITDDTVKKFVSHLSLDFKSKLENELAGKASENPTGESEMDTTKTATPAIPAAGSDNKDNGLVQVVASQGVEIGTLKNENIGLEKSLASSIEEIKDLKTASETHASLIAEKDQAVAAAESKATEANKKAQASNYLVKMFKELSSTNIEDENVYLEKFAQEDFNDESFAKIITDIKTKEEQAKQVQASAEKAMKIKIFGLKEDASDEDIAEVEKRVASKLDENQVPAPPAKEDTDPTKSAIATAGSDDKPDLFKQARASANEAKITVTNHQTGKKTELGVTA